MDTIQIWTKLENRMKLKEIEQKWKNKKNLTIEIEIIGQKMKLQIRKKLRKKWKKMGQFKKNVMSNETIFSEKKIAKETNLFGF